MMKKSLHILSLFLTAILFGQKISDYQNIELKFKDFKDNKYGLNDILTTNLVKKNFVVLAEPRENWSAEIAKNPCDILIAEIVDSSTMFRNKVKIDFKDCNNKTLSSLDGVSMTKEFQPGMQEALRNIIKNIPTSDPTPRPKIATLIEKVTIPTPVIILEEKTAVIPTQTAILNNPKPAQKLENKTEIYSNGKLTLTKIFLQNGEFILAEAGNSLPFAMLKPSTKKEVFHVQLSDGIMTIGYLEEGKIVIDRKSSSGIFVKEIFSQK
jgi:hypothetical protein